MNKYLVIVVGKQFIHPMFLFGDSDKSFKMLSDESLLNRYLYVIYKYNADKDIYTPCVTISKGVIDNFAGYHVKGLIYEN